MSQTTITVVGTIATEPKLIRTATEVNLCSFRLAHDERRFDRHQQAWVDANTNWFRVSVFRSLADHAHESLQKGDRVIVTGRLRVREWENSERRGTSVEIEADALGHDLRWGVTAFTRRGRTSQDEPFAAPDQHASEHATDSLGSTFIPGESDQVAA